MVSLCFTVLPFALLRTSLNVFYMGLRFKSVYAVSFDVSLVTVVFVSVLILSGTAHGLAAGRPRRAELSTNASQKRVQSLRRCRPPADSIEWALRETCFMYRLESKVSVSLTGKPCRFGPLAVENAGCSDVTYFHVLP